MIEQQLERVLDDLFGEPVYLRGGMTLQALRNRVGDADFFGIARTWASGRSGGTGTTAQFIALAETVSGQQLDDLFDAWLFTGSKPEVTSLAAARSVGPVPSAASGTVPPLRAAVGSSDHTSLRRDGSCCRVVLPEVAPVRSSYRWCRPCAGRRVPPGGCAACSST